MIWKLYQFFLINDIKRKSNISLIDYSYYRKLIVNEINDTNIAKTKKGNIYFERKYKKYLFQINKR